jgi:hypothetical protein
MYVHGFGVSFYFIYNIFPVITTITTTTTIIIIIIYRVDMTGSFGM